MITLQRKNRSFGYFSPARFKKSGGIKSDEIALNPSHFNSRTSIDIVATLTHEMVHLWQEHFGSVGKTGYHNREWADKMIEIGLHPSQTGEAGGRETGYNMSHFIIQGAAFELAYQEMEKNNLKLVWSENDQGRNKEKKSGKRTKYVCPICKLSALAKHGARIKCDEHDLIMQAR